MLIDQFAKLDRSSRNAIFAAVLLIGAVAMYNWIVAPHVTYLRAVQRYEPVLDTITREKAELRESLSGRQQMLDQLKAQFGQVQNVIFTYDQARQFFCDLEVVAGEHGCAMASVDLSEDRPISVGDGPVSPAIKPMDTALTVIGEYEGIRTLIQWLQTQDRKIWVRSIAMQVFDAKTEHLRCDLVITIFMIQDKEAASHD